MKFGRIVLPLNTHQLSPIFNTTSYIQHGGHDVISCKKWCHLVSAHIASTQHQPQVSDPQYIRTLGFCLSFLHYVYVMLLFRREILAVYFSGFLLRKLVCVLMCLLLTTQTGSTSSVSTNSQPVTPTSTPTSKLAVIGRQVSIYISGALCITRTQVQIILSRKMVLNFTQA